VSLSADSASVFLSSLSDSSLDSSFSPSSFLDSLAGSGSLVAAAGGASLGVGLALAELAGVPLAGVLVAVVYSLSSGTGLLAVPVLASSARLAFRS